MVPDALGSTAHPAQDPNQSDPSSVTHHASMAHTTSGVNVYHNLPQAPPNPAMELYTPQAQSGDPTSMMRYYYYSYVAPDGSMAYMTPYVPDAAPYVRGEDHEPPTGAAEGAVPPPHPVPMAMSYSMPLYHRHAAWHILRHGQPCGTRHGICGAPAEFNADTGACVSLHVRYAYACQATIPRASGRVCWPPAACSGVRTIHLWRRRGGIVLRLHRQHDASRIGNGPICNHGARVCAQCRA